MKKRGWIIAAVVVALVAIYGVKSYNGLVTSSQGVEAAWSNVETQYQRRADLIPNLVSTVKGYAAHEAQTLEDVVSARAAATSITLDGGSMTPAEFEKYVDAQSKVSSALGRLIAVAENYPDLKANTSFLELQSQLEGTENRITVARKEYNAVVKQYNTAIAVVPRNIIASMFSFGKKEYFAAAEGTENAPKVEF